MPILLRPQTLRLAATIPKPIRHPPHLKPISTMTTGTFMYADPATLPANSKPWGKVDISSTSYTKLPTPRPVTNLRTVSSLSAFTTDTAGFSLHTWPAPPIDFRDEAAVRGAYYDDVGKLLRARLPGKVKKIVIFDHTIRRREKSAPRQPVQEVHVDQTAGAAAARVRRHMDAAEAEELLKGRYQIVNVWRPIGAAASDFPLAVIDWRSTEPVDFAPVDLLYPVRRAGDDGDDRGKEVLATEGSEKSTEGYEVRGETVAVKPNEKHRFYYTKDMTPDEALFLKCFDSWGQGLPGGKDGIAVGTPHTAFEDPETPKDAPGRQSIEIRALVFYE